MKIAIDFDGTLVDHRFPKIGPPVPGAFECLKALQAAGHDLILWTMRSGEHLDAAVDFCKSRGIEFWGVNENPEQYTWTDSKKQYAQIYIDDAALGCPLIDCLGFYRRCVDWASITHMLAARLWDGSN